MGSRDKALAKYLARHAEPEAGDLETLPGRFRHTLVIPFYRESTTALDGFIQFAARHAGTLLIVVSNRPDSDKQTQWHRELVDSLERKAHWRHPQLPLTGYQLDNDSLLLLVDRVLHGPPIPARQGVGLARKIGADIACRLIDQGRVRSPWIANTDADTRLPDDYFEGQATTANAAALVYPFRHVIEDDAPRLATLLYEFRLHYYREGLRWAGSPYAFHTIGSVIAIHYQHYAQVRGFPKRAGAEDFYLLNKLAKTGAVITLPQPLVEIRARRSDRVPFGTGPATAELEQRQTPLAMPLYHPTGFAYLQTFLALLQHLAECPGDYPPEAGFPACPQGVDPGVLQRCCETLGLERALAHSLEQGADAATRLRHLHNWFDGFKTLKLIHYLRDRELGCVPFDSWQQYCRQWQQDGSDAMHRVTRAIHRLGDRDNGDRPPV